VRRLLPEVHHFLHHGQRLLSSRFILPCVSIRTWYSACDLKRRTSATGSLETYRWRSNSCLIRVRMLATGIGRLYIVWISGAWKVAEVRIRSGITSSQVLSLQNNAVEDRDANA
jgi:hypothetical protein